MCGLIFTRVFAPEGELMQGELYSAIKNEEQQTGSDSSTSFSGEMHFYELVEDTKDGIWLVQVGSTDLIVGNFHLQEYLPFSVRGSYFPFLPCLPQKLCSHLQKCY